MLKNVLWLDLETTGLDPNADNILEVAVVYHGPTGVSEAREWVLPFDLNGLNFRVIDPYVVQMHNSNGLWSECRLSTHSCTEVEDAILGMIGDNKPYLAGSSVHFDRGFLRVHMPRLERALSHRHLDMTSVSLFLQCTDLALRKPVSDEHRAMIDIQSDIAFYNKAMARVEQVNNDRYEIGHVDGYEVGYDDGYEAGVGQTDDTAKEEGN